MIIFFFFLQQTPVDSSSRKRSCDDSSKDSPKPSKKSCNEINSDNDSDIEVIPTPDPLTVGTPFIPPEIFSNNNLICSECGEVKSTRQALVRHMLKHKTEFPCQLCSEIFKNPSDLRQHMDLRHTATNTFECLKCDKSFVVETDLATHVTQDHSNDDDEEISDGMCHCCQKIFESENDLNKHFYATHKSENVEYFIREDKKLFGKVEFTCRLCNGRKTPYYKVIKIHVESHFNKLSKEEIDEIYASKEISEEITISDQIVINPDDFYNEEEVILGGNSENEPETLKTNTRNIDYDNTLKCYEVIYDEENDCGAEVDKDFSIQELAQEVDGFWHCPCCSYKGKTKSLLVRHSLYHKSNYRCAICSRCYPGRFHLERHMRTHRGETVTILDESDFVMNDDPNDIEVKAEVIG